MLRRILAATMALALGMVVGVAAVAQDRDDDRPRVDDEEQQQDGRRPGEDRPGAESGGTIRGTLVGVVREGEMVVDYDTNQAAVATVTYLTILGAPGRGPAADRPRERTRSRDRDRPQARESDDDGGSDRSSVGRDEDDDDDDEDADNGDEPGARSDDRTGRDRADRGPAQRQARRQERRGRRGELMGRRPVVYILALTPQTRIRGSGRADQETSFEQLEIGDRVEVEFTRDTRDRPNSDQRHGRDRVVRGEAQSIRILSAPGPRGPRGRSDSDSGSDSGPDPDSESERDGF